MGIFEQVRGDGGNYRKIKKKSCIFISKNPLSEGFFDIFENFIDRFVISVNMYSKRVGGRNFKSIDMQTSWINP